MTDVRRIALIVGLGSLALILAVGSYLWAIDYGYAPKSKLPDAAFVGFLSPPAIMLFKAIRSWMTGEPLAGRRGEGR